MPNWKQPLDQTAGTARSIGRRAERAGRAAESFVKGKVSAVTNRSRDPKELNDETLKAKIESEIFRPEDAPKGSVDVSVADGVVELRGEVKHPEDKESLEKQARKIPEVREVRNLLHLPKTPAPGRADSPGSQKRRAPA
jgi:osmotically-inducible protein OsmY